ncbi:hypothetical protein MICPUN_62136 [Micromonas commoda]|uniref:Uncharacterized protein n=1 Tax=Micromonas commoda (strain RCC299 / NOUM17 / CCMP2709) TaxID=296587 RepID=C1FHM7_MICCC|nr:hypothetical protein MICPUN_62136 [Micromonas commoda]ACO69848.1 hypothetical protein MICPUN_62136 [Micromonas commoda]|eukprot:XP_002508590.1 hypothetical protein MICPUN_62136 [Micromonas commoda]
MLTERPSSRKAPVAEAENIPPPPRRGGRPSKPVDAGGPARTSSAPSPTTWIPEDATPCGEGHRSVESQYQDALRALDADRETLRREVERVIAADAAREGEHASLRDRCAELERELKDARAAAAAADPNDDDDDDDRRQRQPATLAMVRRLRQELSEARAAAAEAARAQVDKIQTLSFSGAPDETELSAVRVEIDRTRAEMAAALGEVSAAAKDRDDALEEVRVELGVLQAERMRLRTRVDSFGKKLQAESTSQGSTADAAGLRARVRDLEATNASLLADAERFESLRVETRALAESIAADATRSAEAEDAMRREIRTVKSELKLARHRLEEERKRREDAEEATERERRGAEEARRVAEEATAAKTKIQSQIQKPKIQKPNRLLDPEALAEVANLRSDLRDEIALVRGALEEMDALASAVHEGKGALAAVKADLERARIDGDAAVDAELERLRAELARFDGETRADVVNVTRTLATTRARMDEAEAEAEEARRAVRAMEGEVARVLDASAGVVAEKEALVAEVNARARELADERAEGEHRRRSHNAEMEELQRQLYALMRDREEALARFRHERNRWGDELREARMGRTSSSFGGTTRRETDGSRSTAGGFGREFAPHVASRAPSSFTSTESFPRDDDGDDDVSRSSSSFAATRRGGHARDGAMPSFAPPPASSPIPGPPPPPPPPPGAHSRPTSAASLSVSSRSSSSRSNGSSVAKGARESANELVNALAAGGGRRGVSSSTSY